MEQGTSYVKLPKLLRTSAFQFAILYMLLFAASVLFLLGFIYWATVGFMSAQFDETIQAEIQGLAEQYRRQGLRGMVSVMNERVLNDPQGESLYLLVNSDLQPLAGNLNEWPALVEDEDGWIGFYLNRSGGRFAAPHMARARVFTLRGGYRLLVGRDIFDLFRVRELIERSLTWGVAITLGLAFLGGVALAKSTRRRIEAITHTSRQIMQGNLSLRVPVRGSGDDFDELADHLNRMLDQIEALMAGVRHVSDNIAHDLRTPLTRVRSRLELLCQKDLPEDARGVVQEIIGEADQLLQTFNALLRIARIESGGYSANFSEVDLHGLVADAVELYEALAADKSQTLSLDLAQGIIVKGDRDLLFQAIANLLDNAIKYTPVNGNVGVRLRAFDQAVISIWDEGPGISEDERDKVVQRFYRVDKTRGLPGNGLGLSMVKAVCEMHKGALELRDNQPGLRAEMKLPLPKALPAATATEQESAGKTPALPG
ncbi:Signal transduction histidine kinase [Hahella chejuensis KCTC 2396]|uniref:histidine kinase n=2 Tax=Hahella chejuensis TaxID=158327 RepID=Q2SPE1_HAHCH|nr:Signal transduction histidine kinase [Hahella chejuensis KCTC 2396]